MGSVSSSVSYWVRRFFIDPSVDFSFRLLFVSRVFSINLSFGFPPQLSARVRSVGALDVCVELIY